MHPFLRAALFGLLVIALVGCAAPQAPRATQQRAGDAPRPAAPKRITAAIMSNPPSLSDIINSTGPGGSRGIDVVE